VDLFLKLFNLAFRHAFAFLKLFNFTVLFPNYLVTGGMDGWVYFGVEPHDHFWKFGRSFQLSHTISIFEPLFIVAMLGCGDVCFKG
jgi:hypothetical protein